MTSTEIARQLLELLRAPKGAVSILAEPEPKTGFALRVWVSPTYRSENIPDEFLGHPVIVQDAPRFSTNY